MDEITSVCLSCLDSDNILNIYDTHECEGIEEIYADMLKSCFDLKIPDNLNGMCLQCVHKLRYAYYFKQDIVKNVQVLLSKQVVKTENCDEGSIIPQVVKNKLLDNEDLWCVIVKNEENQDVKVKTEFIKEEMNVVDLKEIGQKNTSETVRNCDNNETNKDNELVEQHKRKHDDTNTNNAQKKPKQATQALFNVTPDQTDCNICTDTFETHKKLMEHMNVHYNEYMCAVCGKQYACKKGLNRHMITHENGLFPCNICGQEFTKVNSRNAHSWRVHAAEPYSCRQCGARFATFHRRLQHLQQAHALPEKYACPYCDNKYFCAGSRSQHIRSTHMRVRNHKCDKCKMAFFKLNALRSHMATKHGVGEKRHKCPMCEKSFYKTSVLKTHMKRYEFVKCSTCNASVPKFKLQAHLRSHGPKIVLENGNTVVENYTISTEETNVNEDEVLEVETVYFELGDNGS